MAIPRLSDPTGHRLQEPVRVILRCEAKKMPADARPQARKNRRRIRWNTLRIFSGRERRRCLQIVCRSRTALLGQTPGHKEPIPRPVSGVVVSGGVKPGRLSAEKER